MNYQTIAIYLALFVVVIVLMGKLSTARVEAENWEEFKNAKFHSSSGSGDFDNFNMHQRQKHENTVNENFFR